MNRKVTIKVLIELGIEEERAKDFNLEHAILWSANLEHANLRHADLEHADLRNADLWNANLEHADLRHANLEHAILWSANLEHANLRHANLEHADLRHANLEHAILWSANLEHADLSGADLRNADLWNADLSNADLSGADLWNAKIILTLDDYLRIYKIKNTKEYIYLYKITNDNYKSFFASSPITYEIGKEFSVDKCDNNIFTPCSYGLSVATEDWCRKQGEGRILLVKVHWKDVIAVPINTNGKIRVKKLRVIREVK